MDKELKKLFKIICNANNKIIKKDKICPTVFIIDKKHDIHAISLSFSNQQEKEEIRRIIMKMIANSELLGYITILDSYMTKMDKKNKPEVTEVVIRTLYTKDEVIRDWIIHEGTKKLEKFDTSFMKDNNFSDQWNFWDRGITDNKAEKYYADFRDSHPDLYKDL